MPKWTGREIREFEQFIIRDFKQKLEKLRTSGGVPDGFEDDEPASLPKIAMILAAEDIGLTDRAKREIKNLRRFA